MEAIASSPPVPNTGSFLTPLLFSLIGIVATSFSIIVYHFFVVKYCMRRNQADRAPTAAQPPVSGGVEKKVLDAIPVFVFSTLKGHGSRSNQEECVVCLGELCDEELVRLLPNCKHAFHVVCIDEWFLDHKSCPLCRIPMFLQENDDDQESSLPTSGGSGRENHASHEEFSYRASRVRGMLRHCASLEAAAEGRKPRRFMAAGLTRSLSLDQSSSIINIETMIGGLGRTNSSCSPSSSRCKLKRSESNRTRSPPYQPARVSAKLLRSFSLLRGGKGNVSAPILPY